MARVRADKAERAEKTAPAAHFVETGGTLAVGSTNYAIGLVWNSVAADSKIVAQAKAAAPPNGADLFCVRKPGRIQYGLGAHSTGHKSGMAPLASILADVVDGNFVGAFEVPNGIYLVAVRDDQILAGYDRLVENRDEALEAFHELYVVSDWNQSIAPKEWALEGTLSTSLEDLVGGNKPKTRLEPVSAKTTIYKAAGVVLVLGAIYFGYTQYEAYQEQQAQELAAQQLAEQNAREAEETKQRLSFKVPPMPWEGKRMGVPIIGACVDAILAAPIAVAGWQPVSVNCTGDAANPQGWNVSVLLKRAGGTLNWVGPAYNRPGFHPSVTQEAGGNIAVSWPLEGMPDGLYASDTPTRAVADSRRYLTTQFEEVFQPIELRDEAGLKMEVPASTGTAKRDVPLERHLAFSFHTSHDPKDYQEILAPIPVLVAQAIRLEVSSWTWTVEGTTYEQLPLPADLQARNAKPASTTATPPKPAAVH